MKLAVLPGRFSVCRLPPHANPPAPAGNAFWSLTRTSAEISLVVAAGLEPHGARVEGPWRLLRVAGPLDFSLTGVLASLTAPLAEAGVPVFTLSTWDTDYLLVKEDTLEAAVRTLAAAGHEVEEEDP